MKTLQKILFLLVLWPLVACGQSAEKYVAGTHYELLDKPKKIAADDKIEVMEVFWYGCSHCYKFEPFVKTWKQTIASDVEFLRTPAMWDKQGIMKTHASVYYAAEALGVLDKVHDDLFELIVNQQRTTDVERFAKLFDAAGADGEAFKKAYASFGIKGKVSQADKRTKGNYQTRGTPEMIVNGKYRVTTKHAGSQENILDVVDFLISKERLSQ